MLDKLDHSLAKDSVCALMFKAYVEACVPAGKEAAIDYLQRLNGNGATILSYRFHPATGRVQTIVGLFGRRVTGNLACISIAQMEETSLMRSPTVCDELKFKLRPVSVFLETQKRRFVPTLSKA